MHSLWILLLFLPFARNLILKFHDSLRYTGNILLKLSYIRPNYDDTDCAKRCNWRCIRCLCNYLGFRWITNNFCIWSYLRSEPNFVPANNALDSSFMYGCFRYSNLLERIQLWKDNGRTTWIEKISSHSSYRNFSGRSKNYWLWRVESYVRLQLVNLCWRRNETSRSSLCRSNKYRLLRFWLS